jgi:hypothetical protein
MQNININKSGLKPEQNYGNMRWVHKKLTRCDRYTTLSVSHVPITPCQFPLYLIHLVNFTCTYHTSSVSRVSITLCPIPMYLSHRNLQDVMGTWETYRCDRYMGNWQDVIDVWETDNVWWVHGKLTRCDRYMGNLQDVIGTLFPWTHHTLSVSHVPITSCIFPMYLSHFVSFPCIYQTMSVSQRNWQGVIGTWETYKVW